MAPSERFPETSNDDRPIQYGMPRWRDLFSPRQLLCHGTGVEVDRDPRFFAALEAVLEVLPVSRTFTGVEIKGEAAAAGDDFEALYNLTRLAYRDEVGEPEQLGLLLGDGR